MAWFQNLAGRAENLLNKIDQNAATVLNDNNGKLSEKEKLMSEFTNLEEQNNEEIDDRSLSIVIEEKCAKTNNIFQDIDKLKSSSQKLDGDVHNQVSVAACEDIFEKSFKSESHSTKSVSSHNSEEYNEKISELELDVQNLNKQLLNVQHLYAELRNENTNLQSQVDSANYLVATAQSEMEQYKARAQRILQEKEDLILLKNENKSLDNSDHIITNYNDALKKEIEFQQNKNMELSEKLLKCTQENSFLQQQIVSTQNTSQQSNQSLQENLMSEKKIRMLAEEECKMKTHELQLKLQELAQQYNIIQLKNEEISSLQDAFNQKTSVNVNNDVEIQIKSLTNTLMLKQSALETVTTERNALRLQLEKLENEYHNNLAQLERAQVRVINVNDTDDVKSQVPQFMRVSPFDAGVTRRVKHAYSTVDAISVRTGIFLRRYPFARVFVFCYMILLHFWALIVLFLYAPSSTR